MDWLCNLSSESCVGTLHRAAVLRLFWCPRNNLNTSRQTCFWPPGCWAAAVWNAHASLSLSAENIQPLACITFQTHTHTHTAYSIDTQTHKSVRHSEEKVTNQIGQTFPVSKCELARRDSRHHYGKIKNNDASSENAGLHLLNRFATLD